MGEVALAFVATKIQADAGSVLEGAPIGQGFSGRSSLFDVEEAHLRALVGRGSGTKNVIFLNGPNFLSECSKLLY